MRRPPRSTALASVLALFAALTVAEASRALAQDTATDDEAHSLFEAGRTAYDAGRFEAALEYFQDAYALSSRPELLFNVGRAADMLRDTERALTAYRGYLEAIPDAANRPLVERRIAFLSGLGAEEDTDPVVPDAAPSGADAPSDAPRVAAGSTVDVAPWVVVGSGAALAIVGAILVGVGRADADAVEGAPQDGAWLDVADEAERAPILMGTGGALLGVGVAASALGLVWALTAPAPASESVSVGIGPGGITIAGRI